ncbi:hypothetical protein JCM11641_008034 [Rhodosporidiobolus odoratus]
MSALFSPARPSNLPPPVSSTSSSPSRQRIRSTNLLHNSTKLVRRANPNRQSRFGLHGLGMESMEGQAGLLEEGLESKESLRDGESLQKHEEETETSFYEEIFPKGGFEVQPYARDLPYVVSYAHSSSNWDSLRTSSLFLGSLHGSTAYPVATENPQTPPQRVLDIGCGPCPHWILKMGNAWKNTAFVGLDAAPTAVTTGILPPDLESRLSLVQHDFRQSLPFVDGEFDFVRIGFVNLAFGEPDWATLIEEAMRVLKAGGLLEVLEQDFGVWRKRASDVTMPMTTRSSMDPLNRLDQIDGVFDDILNDRFINPSVLTVIPASLAMNGTGLRSTGRITFPISANPPSYDASCIPPSLPEVANDPDMASFTMPLEKYSVGSTAGEQLLKLNETRVVLAAYADCWAGSSYGVAHAAVSARSRKRSTSRRSRTSSGPEDLLSQASTTSPAFLKEVQDVEDAVQAWSDDLRQRSGISQLLASRFGWEPKMDKQMLACLDETILLQESKLGELSAKKDIQETILAESDLELDARLAQLEFAQREAVGERKAVRERLFGPRRRWGNGGEGEEEGEGEGEEDRLGVMDMQATWLIAVTYLAPLTQLILSTALYVALTERLSRRSRLLNFLNLVTATATLVLVKVTRFSSGPSVPAYLAMVFEQDIGGLIKALRANKNDEAGVVQRALDECRKEIQSKDMDIKSAAVLKLVYLEMLGYSMSFAAFAIVECMTSTKFHIKFIGYLAASQCFDRETEVAVLVVNLVKKDLLTPPTPVFSSSPSALTVAHLTSTLSSVALLLTPPLARDLAPDLLSLLTHTRPLVRRQAVLNLWRILRGWPGVQELSTGREERGDDPWVERLRERLNDDDMGVVGAAVNVICEAARKDPRKYLPLAPELFGLIEASTNNWMLIKIIKLFAVLTPEEPRLVKKLLPPLTDLIETTTAMSLLYECIQTSIIGGMLNGPEGKVLAATCVEKLGGFLEDVDQNLRYIALVALVKIAPTHPHLIQTHHDTILKCIDDPDMSIRLRALDLVKVMVNRQNLQPIVKRLLTHLRPSASTTSAAASLLRAQQAASTGALVAPSTPTLTTSYRTSLISLILRMTSNGTYANISNFAWLIDTLVELTYIALTLQPDPTARLAASAPTVGAELRDQLIDIAARVKAIRPYAAKKMAALVQDEEFLENGDGAEAAEVLGAAAWICGEYCRDLEDPRPVIASLFGSSTTSSLPPSILALYVHNGVKIYASWLSALAENWDESSLEQIRSISTALENQLRESARSGNIELQERAAELHGLLELVREGLDAPRPLVNMEEKTGGSEGFLDDDDEEGNGFASSSRAPPTSLNLLHPLFFSHELNPVNSKAQGMVVLPSGLDLDVSLGTFDVEGLEMDEHKAVDEFGRPLRSLGMSVEEAEGGKVKKKKGKMVGKKGKRREVDDDPEEMERLREERLDRQREDPYYIGKSPAVARLHEDDEDDVDSIPIVKLSLDLPRAPSPPPREPTPPPMLVDVEGEMPTDSITSAAPAPRASATPPLVDTRDPTPEKVERAQEGAAVKIVKKKKKKEKDGSEGATKIKKKKAPAAAPAPALVD